MAFYADISTVLAMADAFDDLVNAGASAGKLVFYDGTVPADASVAITTQNVLATCVGSDPFFGAATDDTPGALLIANAISNDGSADATGVCTFYRLMDSNNVVRAQGTCGASGSGANIEFNNVYFVITAVVSITAYTHFLPEQGS